MSAPPPRFIDRRDAGRRLGEAVAHRMTERSEADAMRREPVVLGLPRGGVPVAAEVAAAIDAPLDVLVVRKLGLPHQPEVAMGAIGEHGARVLNDDIVRRAGISESELAAVELGERDELESRLRRFRGARHGVDLDGRAAIIVDDGIATGATARAACLVARERGAAHVLVAVPVAPAETSALLADAADEVLCLVTPEWFMAVGLHYVDFRQTSDAEVIAVLADSAASRGL